MYWRPGNSAAFLSLVELLTGKPLDGSAWVEALATPVDAKVCACLCCQRVLGSCGMYVLQLLYDGSLHIIT